MIPRTYDDWHRCITKDCGITLTRAFVLDRIAVLADEAHQETQRFVQLYGDPHRRSILSWYERTLTTLR
jgi:hypothetical protein